MEHWHIKKSTELYGLNNWGAGYFSINESGAISVSPNGGDGPEIDLWELAESAKERDISLPVLFRFNGILRHRLQSIYNAFQSAINEYDYKGSYCPVYPIKVNQQRHIVDDLRQAGEEYSLGLEVGSKPELVAVIALHNTPNALLICNGYKDREYIEIALMAAKVGRRPLLVIEKPSELNLVLEIAKELNVEPEIGLRLKLAGKGAGRWERSGGERSKFGLTLTEILDAVEELRRREQLSALKLLHFHAGSQLTSISSLKEALKEAAEVYAQLTELCPELSYMDVGGGLGVDYDGSKTAFDSSMNYTLEEYARDVVWIMQKACAQKGVAHPCIVTECGRAMVAYHSVLVYEVMGVANTFSARCDPKAVLERAESLTVQNMAHLLMELSTKTCHETLNDALELRHDMLQEFRMGMMSIKDRSLGDECYWSLVYEISAMAQELPYLPEDLERLPSVLTDTYFCNLSVFQSLPDSWAVEQIFPVAPVNRLNEKPQRRVVLADITCDSDGKIDRFPDLRNVKRYLPAHELRPGENYYFATFLVGAYQEILGDMHNLFGDTNAVHVEVEDDGKVKFSNVVLGDTVKEVLHYVQYGKEDLVNRWRETVENAVLEGRITPSESAQVLKKYVSAFSGYTYLK